MYVYVPCPPSPHITVSSFYGHTHTHTYIYHTMAELFISEEIGNMIGVYNEDGQKCSNTSA